MKRFIVTGVILAILIMSFSIVANADCIPDFTTGDDSVVCSGDVAGSIDGEEGNDVIINNGTIEVDIFGGEGDDTIINNGSTGDDLNGGDGNDNLINNGTTDDMFADDGNDFLINNGVVDDEMRGDNGNDILINNGLVDDDMEGDDGDDMIINNGTVNDDLRGGDGNDLIINSGVVGDDIIASFGNDHVIIQGGVISGLIDGGEDFDILEFKATVCYGSGGSFVENFLSISNLDPSSGSVTLDGTTYNWIDFESLIANLLHQFCDGRNEAFDAGTPLVSYCNSFGGIDIFDVNEIGVDGRVTEGVLVIRTTQAETLAALELAISTGQNQLIATDNNGNQLYALSSNELQIMGPEVHEPSKIYSFIFSPGICGIN